RLGRNRFATPTVRCGWHHSTQPEDHRIMLTRLSLVGLAVLVAVGACGSEPPAASSATSQPEAALPDGATFAWLSSVTTEDVVVDPAELLSGEAAREAAI